MKKLIILAAVAFALATGLVAASAITGTTPVAMACPVHPC
jgi:hypothetical protein